MIDRAQHPVSEVDRRALPNNQQHGLFARPDRVPKTLHVVVPIFNPVRFRSRWALYEKFLHHAEQSGAVVWTVEVAFGERAFAITESGDPHHVQLRTHQELWLKENAINVCVTRLPLDWQYVAWIDADVTFARPDWVGETLHQLQHYPVVQMWSQLHDLDDHYQLVGSNTSFADHWRRFGPSAKGPQRYYYMPSKPGYPGAPGLAWAMRREAWNQLGGLLDVAILGASDWYMAHALTGQIDRVLHKGHSSAYNAALRHYQDLATTSLWEERAILGNLGVVEGVAFHHWHGPKSARLYNSRDEILRRHRFDPLLDLKRDYQGLYQLTNRTPQLRRDVQGYFRQRSEDQLS